METILEQSSDHRSLTTECFTKFVLYSSLCLIYCNNISNFYSGSSLSLIPTLISNILWVFMLVLRNFRKIPGNYLKLPHGRILPFTSNLWLLVTIKFCTTLSELASLHKIKNKKQISWCKSNKFRSHKVRSMLHETLTCFDVAGTETALAVRYKLKSKQ